MKHTICLVIMLITLHGAIYVASATPLPAYEGRGLYVSYCQLCHGTEGKGDGPLAKSMNISPADLTTTVRARSDTFLIKTITGEGRQTITGRDRHNLLSEAMPEWKDIFDESQVKSLVAYLRFMGNSKHKLWGDPNLGQQIYQKYCHVCHGEDGEGDGVMTKLIGIMEINLTESDHIDQLNNKELAKNILDGQGEFMPAWRGILSQNEVEALVSYIRLLSQ